MTRMKRPFYPEWFKSYEFHKDNNGEKYIDLDERRFGAYTVCHKIVIPMGTVIDAGFCINFFCGEPCDTTYDGETTPLGLVVNVPSVFMCESVEIAEAGPNQIYLDLLMSVTHGNIYLCDNLPIFSEVGIGPVYLDSNSRPLRVKAYLDKRFSESYVLKGAVTLWCTLRGKRAWAVS